MKPSHKRLILNNQKQDPTTYNLKNGLVNFRTAINNLYRGEEKIYNISLVGDSITQGLNATNELTTSWHALLRGYFNTLFDDVGVGCIPIFYTVGGSALWTFAGGFSTTGCTDGIGGRCTASVTNGATATITFNGTGVKILCYRDNTTGTITATIDGGTPLAIDTYSETTIRSHAFEITGLEDGNHTLLITKTGTDPLKLQAIIPIKGTSGLLFNMVGRSSQLAANMSGESPLAAEIDVHEPVLTIIGLTANDFNGQTALSTYKSQLQTIITRAKQYGDVLITTIGPRIASKTITQDKYVDVCRELAVENNVAFLDIWRRWGSNATYARDVLGFIDVGQTVHPNDVGHRDMYLAVLNALGFKE